MRRQPRSPDRKPEERGDAHAINLPNWAPRALCARLLNDPVGSHAAEVRQRLLTDRRMEKVWPSTARALVRAQSDEDPVSAQYRFAHVVFEALDPPSGLSGMTRGQAKRAGEAIKKATEKLSDRLRRIGFLDMQCLRTVEPEQFARAIEQELRRDDDPTMLMCSGVPGVPLRRLKEHQFPKILAARLMRRELLSFGDVLTRIAEWAVRERKFSFLGKPNDANAGRLYMVYRLSSYCKHTFRSPLPQVVAVTTTVALNLDRELTRDDVRRMTRDLERRLPSQ